MNKKLAFIGAGNMSSSIIRGLVKSGKAAPSMIFATDIDNKKLDTLRDELGIQITENNLEAIEDADYIFLCVKPDKMPSVCHELRNHVQQSSVLVSIAAGITQDDLKRFLGADKRIIRIMPNLPISVGEGMCMICENERIEKAHIDVVKDMLLSLGECIVMDEKYINAFVALAGSSPTFIFMIIEAMADGGVMMGIPRDKAYTIASQAVLGSAKMVLDTKQHPGELKDMVCSPSGTTIEAVAALEETGLRHSLINAMKVCIEKAEKMDRSEK